MKTQNNKLVFNKSVIVELQNTDLFNINGGSTIVGGPTCTGCNCINVSIIVGNPDKTGPILIGGGNNGNDPVM